MPYIKDIGRDTTRHTLHTLFKMRKIEAQMCTAIERATDWKSGNTRVEAVVGASRVYLHGNLIAEVGENYMTIFDGGWQTTTTKSRLNALLSTFGLKGERVFQKDFKWFVGQAGGPIPFFSGMRLN